jgi:hypothetical protein
VHSSLAGVLSCAREIARANINFACAHIGLNYYTDGCKERDNIIWVFQTVSNPVYRSIGQK